MANHCANSGGPGLLQVLAGISSIPHILAYRKRPAKNCKAFLLCHEEVTVEEKEKKVKDLTPGEREAMWEATMAPIRGELEADRQAVITRFEDYEKKMWEEMVRQVKEAENNSPPGSFLELMKLIAIVQDKSPEADEALRLLIERHFQRRRVLYITSERLRLEEMWKLELSPDEWGELHPLKYERDVAPLPLLETIEECGDYPLEGIRDRMRKTMRNYLVKGGAQGRNIDSKEVEREYRLKEFGDEDNSHEIRPNLSKWDTKEGFFKGPSKYRNPEYDLQYTTEASPAYRADPWDPREVIDIAEEDKPLWDAICKAIPLLDDIDLIIVESIMYKIPLSKQSKKYGIPEGTLRSRKSRLGPKVLKIATKWLSSSVSYMEKDSKKDPYKKGQKPDNIGP